MPRAGLTRDRVADEALTMVDEVGLAQLTLAGLAQRLGVRQPSLYKHIGSIADLRRDVSVRSVRLLGTALARAAVGRSGADSIRSMATTYRQWALAHPAWYEASQAKPSAGDTSHADDMLEVIATIAAVLTAYELEGDDSIDAIRALRSMLHGFVTFEAQGTFELTADIDRSFERMIDGYVVALAQWGDAGSS